MSDALKDTLVISPTDSTYSGVTANNPVTPSTPAFTTQSTAPPLRTVSEPNSTHSTHSTHSQQEGSPTLNTTYTGEIIPPDSAVTGRTLVLCFDGTGDQFDSDNSNIVQLFSMLKKGDPNKQLVYYQAGIGTYTIPQIATPFISKVRKTLDMALASNLNYHVMGGYEFLMQNYVQGDKICIFGFSRGAYTARALAGMIHKVGLLPRDNHQQIAFAYKMYMDNSETGWDQSTLFKLTFSIDVDIEFVGVWDTVASVGLIPRRLPFVQSNTCIKTFRHAISLDEHRAKFRPNHYQLTTDGKHDFKPPEPRTQTHKTHSIKIVDGIVHAAQNTGSTIMHAAQQTGSSIAHTADHLIKNGNGNNKKKLAAELEAKYQARSRKTDFLEVYFTGCHCDVGGGSVGNEVRHSLARIPLRWMIRQCFLANTGIQFEADIVRDIAGIDPNSLWPEVKKRPDPLPIPHPPPILDKKASENLKRRSRIPVVGIPAQTESVGEDSAGTAAKNASDQVTDVPYDDFLGEEEEDLRDALCPIYDQLELSPLWWILEFWPIREEVHLPNGTKSKVLGINLGRPRQDQCCEGEKLLFHRTVKMRMEAMQYKPRLEYHNQEPEFVD